MNHPTMVILHKLPNRVRFKLSHPLRDEIKTKKFLIEYEGITDFEYNSITKSVLIHFNKLKTELNEVTMRLAVSYSKDYDMLPINIYTNVKPKETALAYYSIAGIISTGLLKSFKIVKNQEIENFLNWAVVGTTASAIVDHGYREIKEKGAFDPELVSVMYFFNSVINGKYLTGSLVTWLAAFGRHIIDIPYKGTTVKIKEFKNIYTNKPQYSISIYSGTSVSQNGKTDNINIIRDILSKLMYRNQSKFRQNFFMDSNMMLDSQNMGTSINF